MPLQSIRPLGFVYFVHAPVCNLIKIGYSDRYPDTRFSSLQVSSPVPLVPLGFIRGGRDLERALHAKFRDHLHHGEWFETNDDLVSLICSDTEAWTGLPPKPKGNERYRIRWGKLIPIRKLALEMKAKTH